MPGRLHRRSRVIATIGVFAVLALAALLRFWALGRPGTLVFDELYYVRDAVTQLANGFPTSWPDDDPSMATPFTDDASFAVHPPLGKWIIALGLLVFGDGSWGWRAGVALTGVVTVGLTMLLGWRISRSTVVALLAGLFLAVDGVHVVLTRVGLLDGILAAFVVLGALFMWRDHERVVDRTRLTASGIAVQWSRPWLFAAAIAFGCAASVKWSGLYPLAAFLLLTAARDLLVRVVAAREAARTLGVTADLALHRHASTARALGRWTRQAFATGVIALPTAAAVYVASWAGWILTTGGWGRADGPWPSALWQYHVGMFEWHSTLSAPHPYQAHPLSWPLGLRPTAMYHEVLDGGLTATISPLPNILITWGGVAALILLTIWGFRALMRPRELVRRSPVLGAGAFAAAFVVTGYLSGWLPWVLTLSRSAVFQFYAVVLTPFSAVALALVIGVICRRRGGRDEVAGRRIAVGIFVAAAVIVSVLFFPVWSAMPVPEWFWRWHLWLPGWV
ncbi:phospholipid carrier-dependent glycosyltransferase [Leucobacter komagatae]|uniref:phospholipid carrier-dependent glycosyltransferase n=1 Tax=Leucobacter komagatae TaxID=55969 RepID=UPI000AAF0E9A|nr:phospholipid carrier-dependent glycosyltransferase [Leucobacter komagatae]